MVALGLLGIGAGGVAYWRVSHKAAPPPAPAAKETPLPAGAEVQVSGKIRAANVVRVPAPVEGTLEEFPVRPGDEVFEGQIIGRIRNDNLAAAEREAALELERAQARLQAAESALIASRLEQSRLEADLSRARGELAQKERVYTRQSLLNREGATPRRTFENAQQDFEAARAETNTLDELVKQVAYRIEKAAADVKSARKSLDLETEQYEEAKQNLASADIRSPADGIVVAIRKAAGDEVTREEQALFEIAVELVSLELVVEPEPPIVNRLKPGLPALIRIAEIPGEGLPAQVKSIDGGQVVIEFASPDPVIRPGMTALAVLRLP